MAAKTPAPKKKMFTVSAKFRVATSIRITADSLEDALMQARAFTADNFVDFLGDVNEYGTPDITSVWEN